MAVRRPAPVIPLLLPGLLCAADLPLIAGRGHVVQAAAVRRLRLGFQSAARHTGPFRSHFLFEGSVPRAGSSQSRPDRQTGHIEEYPMHPSPRRLRLPVSASSAIALALGMAVPAQALVITTTDPAVVSAFQSGASVEDFDDLTAFPITSYAAGQTVPASAQFSSRDGATQPTFHSGGASPNDPVGNPGTPIGIFAPSGAIAGDVRSAPNVAGPLVINSDEAFNFGFMEVIFPVDMARAGFWLTEGSVLLQLRDVTGNTLPSGDFEVTASEGQFVGISRDSADARVAALVNLTEAFTIDDFTWATTPVPEPGVAPSLALAGALLGLWGRRRPATGGRQ